MAKLKRSGAVIGYGRVSTEDQTLETQRKQLVDAGCESKHLYLEKVSGKTRGEARPQLERALHYLREGDALVVTRLDRLARSTRDLLNIAHELAEKGVALRVLDLGIDTVTPAGELFFTVMSGIAQFERAVIRERQRAGIDRARLGGEISERTGRLKYAGRPKLVDRERVRRLLKGGLGPAAVAREIGCARSTVYEIKAELASE